MRRLLGLAVALACPLAGAAQAQAAVGVHAHRGGPLQMGVPISPENSLPAFTNSWDRGADVIELDSKLSKDDVPVVIHDDTLDRTTDCEGTVGSRTAAEVAACHVDILGTDGTARELPDSSVRVPTLAQALDWAKGAGARLNLEIKNQPGESDFEGAPMPAYARTVIDAVEASGIPKKQVLIQSFWPPNLDVAKARGFRTSFLTLQQSNEGGIDLARTNGYDVISPGWPLADPKAFVTRAHAAGLEVVPYTLDERADQRAAEAAGVDAIITNDPALAFDTVITPLCVRERSDHAKIRSAIKRAVRRVRSASTRAARAAARSDLRRARRRHGPAHRELERACPPF